MNIIYVPFFVVTKPTALSTLADICFECTFQGLKVQFLGGLDPDQIFGVYTYQPEAINAAKALLKKAGLS